jgi:chloramphenicol O-acetyltransferase type B
MAIRLNAEKIEVLKQNGLEVFPGIDIDENFTFAAPCGLKWSATEQSVELGAFSYMVSGYLCGVKIGRYCSFGENIQIGRQSHPLDWISTSPFLYMPNNLIVPLNEQLQAHCIDSVQYLPLPPTSLKKIEIGHDVWIGHAAIIMPGIKIGNGAIVAAGSVVTKDVAPYSIVGGNPANFIKFRLPFDLIAEMQATAWWEYAPKDLNQFPIWSPEQFVKEFQQKKSKLKPYVSDFKKVSDLIQ